MTSRAALACVLLLTMASAAAAQMPPPRPSPPPLDAGRKFEILDNSFLVEESFNQEAHVVQNIFSWMFARDGEWDATFTQEWPLWSMTHQFSYTVPFARADGRTGVGDVLLNYRFQLLQESAGRPAFAPRISIIMPTGRFGSSVVGLQVNAPFSKQFRDLYVHWNAGWTWRPRIALIGGGDESLTSPQVAASGIWRVSPMFNLMLESVVQFEESIDESAHAIHERIVTISPGFRRGWNVGDRQIVVGAAVPVSFADSDRRTAVLTYVSYELPFGR